MFIIVLLPQSRPLTVSSVMSLLSQQPLSLRWRYLEHLVISGQTRNPKHHTELALVLVQSAQEAQHDSERPSESRRMEEQWNEGLDDDEVWKT